MMLGAAALASSIASTEAADLYSDGRGMKDGYAVQQHLASQWYFRLDTGYGLHDQPRMVEDGLHELSRPVLEGAWTLGGGIGRSFSPNLRGEISLDYRFEADVRAVNADPVATFRGLRSLGLSSTVLLANLYYDVGHFGRFQPYVGAGLGTVYHEVSGGPTRDGTIGDGSSWHVAGALMAGVAMPVSGSLKLDAGYRFLYLGETATGAITGTGPLGAPAVAKDPTVEDLHAHRGVEVGRGFVGEKDVR